MTDTVETTAQPADPNTAQPSSPPTIPKSALVKKLLQRAKGASLAELQEATAWQAHSVRAYLSGMRKKGDDLAKEQRKSGETAYRLMTAKKPVSDA